MPTAGIFSIEITLKDQKSITCPVELHKLKGQATCNAIGALGHLLSLASLDKIHSAKIEEPGDEVTIDEHDGCFFAVGRLIACFADQACADIESLSEAVTATASGQ